MNTNKFVFVVTAAIYLSVATVLMTMTMTSAATLDDPNQQRMGRRGPNRVLAQYTMANNYYNTGRVGQLTCDNNPSMCRPGTSCCRRQCVNLRSDLTNCGQCGKWCGYGQICCNGRCASLLFDTNNCGSCGNKCNKGSRCTYGMCSYAA